MRIRKRIVVILLIVSFFLVKFSRDFIYLYDVGPNVIDGNLLQYKIVDEGQDGKWRTSDDHIWELTLPKRTLVERRPFDPDTLKVWFDIESFDVLEWGDLPSRDGSAEVTFFPHLSVYGKGELDLDEGFLWRFELWRSLYCRESHEIGGGVVLLRRPTDAELSEVPSMNGHPVRKLLNGCFGAPDSIAVLFYRNGDEPAGMGLCRELPDRCTIDVWLPQRRRIFIRLDRQDLAKVSQIDFAIQSLISDEGAGVPILGR